MCSWIAPEVVQLDLKNEKLTSKGGHPMDFHDFDPMAFFQFSWQSIYSSEAHKRTQFFARVWTTTCPGLKK